MTNATARPRIIWVEPWGGDFTLLPGETVRIVGRSAAGLPTFAVVEHDGGTQVFVEGGDPAQADYEVIQDGKQLSAGHNSGAGAVTP